MSSHDARGQKSMDPEEVRLDEVPVLASTAHPQVRDVLKDDGLAGSKMGEAMIRALELQLELHEQQDTVYRELINERDEDIVLPILKDASSEATDSHLDRTSAGQGSQTLFAQAAIRIATELGQANEDEAQAVIKKVPLVGTAAFRSAIFQAIRLPYPVVNRALHFASKAASLSAPSRGKDQNPHLDEIDEWIIRNEKYMRARLILDAPKTGKDVDHPTDEAVAKLGIDRSSSHWQHFMVGLGRDASQIFGPSDDSDGTITITRPDKAELPGLLILDEQRKDHIKVNTLSAFVRRFELMTRGILKGLDWNHVMIAGGLPLAVLTSVTDEQAAEHQGSDIDMYLYGLGPEQATAKLQEIEKVFKANLPTNESTGEKMKYAVLRNSQTVTFVPEVYPNRRLQVVLKLCPNPMAVLLNFDLDQVGVAYDGTEVWMLPRTARAIITSYTVFTMDLIQGSFLAARKATQDQRVFKYAKRGYGVRVLPSYVETLPRATGSTRIGGEMYGKDSMIDSFLKESSLSNNLLHATLLEERHRIAWWLAWRRGVEFGPDTDPISMKELDSRRAVSAELAERSSLSGWQHFVRHVALWEYSQKGYFPLELNSDSFCAADYGDDPQSYQDGPDFSWDSDFTLDRLRENVDESNERDSERFHNSLVAFEVLPFRPWRMDEKTYENLKTDHEARHLRPRQTLQRTIMALTLEEAFSQPLAAFVHLPRNFRTHVEPKLSSTPSRFADVTLPGAPRHKRLPQNDWMTAEQLAMMRTDEEFVLSYWIQDGTKDGRLTPHWQLVNREADEIHEIIHAFRRANRDLQVTVSIRNKQARRFVSRRLVRPTDRSEREAFKEWASERVQAHAGFYGDTEEWAMLDANRGTVFGRFNFTKRLACELEGFLIYVDEDDEEDDGSFRTEPKTAKEWLARSRNRSTPEWVRWYKCRLPPVHLLEEIRSLAKLKGEDDDEEMEETDEGEDEDSDMDDEEDDVDDHDLDDGNVYLYIPEPHGGN